MPIILMRLAGVFTEKPAGDRGQEAAMSVRRWVRGGCVVSTAGMGRGEGWLLLVFCYSLDEGTERLGLGKE